MGVPSPAPGGPARRTCGRDIALRGLPRPTTLPFRVRRDSGRNRRRKRMMPKGTENTYDPANPLIVQGDRSVLVEVDNPRYTEARDALAPFADLEKSPE